MNTKILELTQIAIFAAIIAVCAQVTIPMPYGVPMTLQTFAVPLAGVVLGARKGALAVLAYILLGAVGVPVFAGLTGGLGIIFGVTGGFILSFPLMALAAAIGAAKPVSWTFEGSGVTKKLSNLWLALWLVIGTVINYICGMLMFSFVTDNSLTASFGFVVVPFIPTAVIKIIMVLVSAKAIRQALVKARVL